MNISQKSAIQTITGQLHVQIVTIQGYRNYIRFQINQLEMQYKNNSIEDNNTFDTDVQRLDDALENLNKLEDNIKSLIVILTEAIK